LGIDSKNYGTQSSHTTSQVGSIFMNEIHRLCGFDKVIGSEKDPIFIRKFWKGLWNIIGTTLSMTSR